MPNQSKPRVAGAIFQNTSGRGPEYTGVVEIDGVKTQIALWPKVSQGGKNYLQISEDRKRPQGAGPGAPRPSGSPMPQRPQGYQPGRPAQPKKPDDDDMDDTIPF